MRRVELIARRPAKGDRATNHFENIKSRDSEFFRRNTGGDEFVFVLEEGVDGAVGFLKRIIDKTLPKIEKEIILSAADRLGVGVDSVNIGFCAGITTIEKSDSVESLLDWAEQLLWDAKNARHDLSQCVLAIGSRSDEAGAVRLLFRSHRRDERGNSVWSTTNTT